MPESSSMAVTDRSGQADEKKPSNREEFMALARKRFNRASASESINRTEAVDDLKFKKGEQWPDDIRSQRTIEKRPCLTINKMKTFVHQITNDQRQNRPAINVSPVGDKSDPKTAQMLKGLIRQIERQSNADIAYDTGFDSAVSNGWGYWRVLTDYEDERTFNQVIRIGRIRNPFRVYLDPDCQSPEGSDAKWGFISDFMTREEFKSAYPKAAPVAWQEQGLGDEFQHWVTQTHIRVAEYFYFETKKRKLVHLANGHVGFEDELAQEVRDMIELDPTLVVKERESETRVIHWDTISANEVLEANVWAGKWIPIVRCIGDETDVEGEVSFAGLVRDAKDPQRMYNYWVTSETEMIALAPKAPFILEEGQIEGHEKRWQDANTKSYPYLLYKGTNVAGKPAPMPQRQQFAGPPTGIVNAKISAAQDMQATTGIRFDATMQERMYDESGKALRELKRVGDLGNFHYIDNLSRALRHTGRILIDLIPKIYDTPRVLTILREDDSEERVMIEPQLAVSHQTKPGPGGEVQRLYNPKLGDYEVAVTVGPSFATKRAEASDSMMAFMKAVPQSAPVIGDLIAKNMDWPGAQEISERLAAMLPPQLMQKGMDDLPPEARAMIGSMQQQMQQMQGERDKAVAMLGDKEADRSVERDKINADFTAKMESTNKTFEAALTKIAADMQANMCDMMNGRFESLSNQVLAMEEAYRKQRETDANIEALAREAMRPSGNA